MIIPVLTPSGSQLGTVLVGDTWKCLGMFLSESVGAIYLWDQRKPEMPAAV